MNLRYQETRTPVPRRFSFSTTYKHVHTHAHLCFSVYHLCPLSSYKRAAFFYTTMTTVTISFQAFFFSRFIHLHYPRGTTIVSLVSNGKKCKKIFLSIQRVGICKRLEFLPKLPSWKGAFPWRKRQRQGRDGFKANKTVVIYFDSVSHLNLIL